MMKTLKVLLLIGSIGNCDGSWYCLDNQVPQSEPNHSESEDRNKLLIKPSDSSFSGDVTKALHLVKCTVQPPASHFTAHCCHLS